MLSNAAGQPDAVYLSCFTGDCKGSTFTHELGHNAGLMHNIEIAPQNGVFPYSRGAFFKGTDQKEYYTIMAYGTKDPNLVNWESDAVRVDKFTGTSTMHAGAPTGSATADSVKSLQQILPIMSKYR